MTKEQWSLVESHFETLRMLPPSEAQTLLSAIPDPQIQTEIGAMLERARKSAAALLLPVGERIGPYRMGRRLGSGGQGTVYEAVRDDGSFEQHVAVKIVRWEMDDESARTQFRRERQILARLEHPNIARLLDGGETESGTPYLVMEYVDGLALTEATKGWPIRRKLDLFLEIAAAVSFAHRNLIVHRDLKPGNILVTQDGVSKLLDFGIAKLLDADSQRTATLLQALTPNYASPEQVRGEPITAASDIYSLGVVLFELLTGSLPYELPTLSPAEVIRVVCETPPKAPHISEDLDNIILMALRKEPSRRYSSVEQFAQDVERSLTHRPVLARKDTLRYLTGKFVRRNAWQIAAVSIIIFSLSAGLAFSITAERRANRRFNEVRQLANRFLFDVHDEIAGRPGNVKAREMIVSTALEYLQKLARDASGDVGLQWELAVAYAKVAAVQGSPTGPSLSQYREALASYDKALALARPLAQKRLLDARQTEALTGMLCDAAMTSRFLREYDAAEKFSREAITTGAASSPMHMTALRELALALEPKGDVAGSLNAQEQILTVARDAAQIDPSIENRHRIASTLVNMGMTYLRLANLEKAKASEIEAAALLRQLAMERPNDPRFPRLLNGALWRLGDVEGAKDRPSFDNYTEAANRYEEAIAVIQPMADADPNDRAIRVELGLTHSRIGVALCETEPAKALAHAIIAAGLFDAYARDRAGLRALPRISQSHAYRAQKQFAAAEKSLLEAAQVFGKPDLNTEADLTVAWAQLETDRGNRVAAAKWFDRAITNGEQLYRANRAVSYARVAARMYALMAGARPETAAAANRRILEIWTEQSQRLPGSPYVEMQLEQARKRLPAP